MLGFKLRETRSELQSRETAGFWICVMSKRHLISCNRRRKLFQTRKTCLLLLCFEEDESDCQARRICVLYNPIFCVTPFSLLNKVTHKFCYNGIIYLILLHIPTFYVFHLDLSPFLLSFLFLEITSE